KPAAAAGRSRLLASERVLAGERLADDEGVHLVRALVRQYRLEVVHVADHRVLERDPVAAEDRPRRACHLERSTDVAHLAHAHVLGPQGSLVLHAAEVESDERATVHLEGHLRELLLRELIAGYRFAEHDALLRVVERRLEARSCRPDRPPDDPVAG